MHHWRFGRGPLLAWSFDQSVYCRPMFSILALPNPLGVHFSTHALADSCPLQIDARAPYFLSFIANSPKCMSDTTQSFPFLSCSKSQSIFQPGQNFYHVRDTNE